MEPVTIGAAMLVPGMRLWAVGLAPPASCEWAASMSFPGAQISGLIRPSVDGPRLEKLVIAPIVGSNPFVRVV